MMTTELIWRSTMTGLLSVVLVLVMSVLAFAAEGSAPTEPALGEREDVILVCDFENDDWWKAWGASQQPGNTDLIGPEGRALM